MNLLPLLNDPDLMARLNRRAAVFTEAQNDRRLLDAERRAVERDRQHQRDEARRAKLALLDGEDLIQ